MLFTHPYVYFWNEGEWVEVRPPKPSRDKLSRIKSDLRKLGYVTRLGDTPPDAPPTAQEINAAWLGKE